MGERDTGGPGHSRVSKALRGRRVAFTGALASMPRRRAAKLVETAGGHVTATVSRQTDLLVVGTEGWQVLKDGRISHKLQRAEALQADGHAIAIVSEWDFLERVGLGSGTVPAGHTCTLTQAERMFGIDTVTLRRWRQFGLIRARDDAIDFHDLVSLRALARLMAEGWEPAAIARALNRLARFLPDAERPLAQARIVDEQGAGLVAEVEGARIGTGGQLVLDLHGDARGSPGNVGALRPRGRRAQARRLFDEAYDLECEGRLAEAEQRYRAALGYVPDFPEAHYNLGNVRCDAGDLLEAEFQYRQAVEAEPGFAPAWYNLGYVLDQQGRLEEAVLALGSALELIPDFADAHFNLAACYERLGLSGQAATHWRAYLRLEPAGSWAGLARDRLSALVSSAARTD